MVGWRVSANTLSIIISLSVKISNNPINASLIFACVVSRFKNLNCKNLRFSYNISVAERSVNKHDLNIGRFNFFRFTVVGRYLDYVCLGTYPEVKLG